jgi:hypothetical protein
MRPRHRIRRCGRADHQAGAGKNALAMRLLDSFIDRDRKAEIICRENYAAWRSRRN